MSASERPSAVPEVQARDADLLVGADPDGTRFAVFYRRHVQAVLRYLAQQGVDAWTAADVTAETFAAAVVQRSSFDPAKVDARPWLLAIARNKLADSRRRWARERRLQQRLGMERIELSHDDIEAYQQLLDVPEGSVIAALETLPVGQRSALRARVIGEKPYAEVGREIGASPQASRQQARRGLQALRRLLAGASE